MVLRLASWNVNGIRAAAEKGLSDFVSRKEFDLIMLQEIKADGKQIPEVLHHMEYGLKAFPAQKKGYGGLLTMYREKPLDIRNGMGVGQHDSEARVQVIELDDIFVLNTYFPNSQRGLTRLDYKLEFNSDFMKFCQDLRKRKPLVICGDFNVAHEDIDIARPNDNRKNAGFTQQERDWMTSFLDAGYLDTFRMFNSEGGNYSWWTYRFGARERNIGWRIDYFIVSRELEAKVSDAGIMGAITGSDHAPVTLVLDL